jgi:hypothetical protein
VWSAGIIFYQVRFLLKRFFIRGAAHESGYHFRSGVRWTWRTVLFFFLPARVVCSQMLYGCRPYGEGHTQERVWNDGIIANAGEVVFPALPKVRYYSWVVICVLGRRQWYAWHQAP